MANILDSCETVTLADGDPANLCQVDMRGGGELPFEAAMVISAMVISGENPKDGNDALAKALDFAERFNHSMVEYIRGIIPSNFVRPRGVQ